MCLRDSKVIQYTEWINQSYIIGDSMCVIYHILTDVVGEGNTENCNVLQLLRHLLSCNCKKRIQLVYKSSPHMATHFYVYPY